MRVLEASVDRAGVRRHQVEAVAPHIDILLIAAQQQTVRKAARADEAIGLAQPAVANGLFTALRTSFVQSSFSGTGNLEEPRERWGLPAPDASCEALELEKQGLATRVWRG